MSSVAESLREQHRKEQRDLQARITQKKKNATKKTRRGVNEECEALQRELAERQEDELRNSVGNGHAATELDDSTGHDKVSNGTQEKAIDDPPRIDSSSEDTIQTPAVSDKLQLLSLSTPAPLPSSQPPIPQQQSKKPSRAKQRLARRALDQEAAIAQAEREAEDIPDLRAQEQLIMHAEIARRGFVEKQIQSDGHCLYAAVADLTDSSKGGLETKVVPGDGKGSIGGKEGIPTATGESGSISYQAVRDAVATYMAAHETLFRPFLDVETDSQWRDYLRRIRETGEWGGQVEIVAISKIWRCDVCVLEVQGGVARVERVTSDAASVEKAGDLWLAYYRHMYGLGAHYNSLRKLDA